MIAFILVLALTSVNPASCTITYKPTMDQWFRQHSLGVGYKTCKADPQGPLRRGLR